jgi:hypothetical protein
VLKVCSKCKESKPLDYFGKCSTSKDGKQWQCKTCKQAYKKSQRNFINKQQKEYRKQHAEELIAKRRLYIAKNIEYIQEKNRQYKLNNKEKLSQQEKERRKNNPERAKEISRKSKLKHRDKILIANKEYRQKNKEKIKEYQNKPEVIARRQANRFKNKEKINANKRHKEQLRRNTDPTYKLITNQRTRITGILKKHKTSKTLDLLGCSAQFLRTYIEDKFLEGMTWDNYGKYGWHVDHITPCSSFNLTDIEQQKKCFHYTNLQPLWAIDNLKKSNKLSLNEVKYA